MGPGIPNPMLWGSGDPLDEFGKIERSIRLRASAGAYFTRAFASQDDTWTAHFWIKRSDTSAVQTIAGTRYASGQIGVINIENDALKCANSGSGSNATSSGLFRDYAAFIPVTVTAVAGGLRKIYVEDNLVASAAAGAAPFLFTNAAGYVNTIGRYGDSASNYLGAYLANFAYVAGRELTPSTFALRHPRTGQWRPKTKAAIRSSVAAGGGTRNGWGANGFFLPFDGTSSVAALGYDRSQSDTDTTGNNWTPNNISLTPGATYDSMLDTPTNNFCVLNPVSSVGMTLANGNLDFTTSLAAAPQNGFGTVHMRKGKFQFEVQPTWISSNNSTVVIGICGSTSNVSEFYSQSTGYAYRGNGQKCSSGGAFVAYGSALDLNGIVGGVFDADLGTLEFFLNGVSMGVAFTGIPAGDYVVAVADTGTTVNWGGNINCGQRPFAYPVVGAKGISTKSLPVRYPVMRSADAFVAKTDSGANIKTALEAASPWDKWIRIYKRRDAAEGWRWQFSDDSGYYLDSSASAAKAAFPTLAGTSYVGYALKVAASNGVATGRLVHTNGVADTVTDGLVNSRKAVILVNEAGSNWYFYHPDLTAGKLLYLNSTAAETADTTISSVTASGFTVAAALASGTYRWIAIAEIDGFIKLGFYTGNGGADGPVIQANFSAAFAMAKRFDSANSCHVRDTARNAGNPTNYFLYPHLAAQEDSAYGASDINSDVLKIRVDSTQPAVNAASGKYGFVSIAAFPFRYANAR